MKGNKIITIKLFFKTISLNVHKNSNALCIIFIDMGTEILKSAKLVNSIRTQLTLKSMTFLLFPDDLF